MTLIVCLATKEGQAELASLFDRLLYNLQTAAALFMTRDERTARVLAEEKVVFRKTEREGAEAHFERLRQGRIESVETNSLHLDLLRDLKFKFKLVNSHLVAAAYPVLEGRGELLPSRTVTPDTATVVEKNA